MRCVQVCVDMHVPALALQYSYRMEVYNACHVAKKFDPHFFFYTKLPLQNLALQKIVYNTASRCFCVLVYNAGVQDEQGSCKIG